MVVFLELWFNNKFPGLERENTFHQSMPRKLHPILPPKKSEMITQLEQQLEITKLPTEIVFNQNKHDQKRQNDNLLNDEKISIDRQMSTLSSQPSVELSNEINADKLTKPILVTEGKKVKKVKKKKDEEKEKEKEEKEKKKEKKSKKKLKELKALSSEVSSLKSVKSTDSKKPEKDLDETRLDNNKETIVRFSKQQTTQEMLNNIDYIWDVNRLNLLLEDATQCLGSIKEELPPIR